MSVNLPRVKKGLTKIHFVSLVLLGDHAGGKSTRIHYLLFSRYFYSKLVSKRTQNQSSKGQVGVREHCSRIPLHVYTVDTVL